MENCQVNFTNKRRKNYLAQNNKTHAENYGFLRVLPVFIYNRELITNSSGIHNELLSMTNKIFFQEWLAISSTCEASARKLVSDEQMFGENNRILYPSRERQETIIRIAEKLNIFEKIKIYSNELHTNNRSLNKFSLLLHRWQ